MRIRYTWRPEEWREALLLASQGPRRGTKSMVATKSMVPYAMIGIMALGAVGEIANAVRSSAQIDFAGSLAPMLLLGAGIACIVLLFGQMAGRNRRLRETPPMPTQEQELLLQEEGWASASAGELPAAPMRSWKELEEQRTGRRTLILVGPGDGPDRRFAAVPLRVLSTAQGGHLHRLVTRKLRPSF